MTDNLSASRDNEPIDLPRISTGSAGLDDILGGGFDANRMYLYEGKPETGKTTIALQFLLKGADAGERALYHAVRNQTRVERRRIAAWLVDEGRRYF
jgi:circadian clock protein KaiC